MIQIETIKRKLKIDAADTSRDAEIEETIERNQSFLKGYCNNDKIDFEVDSALDVVVIYLVLKELNPDTALSQGKAAESMGASFTYLTDLPNELKGLLRKYRRFSFL